MRGELQGMEIPDEYLPVAVAVVIGLILVVILFQCVSNAQIRKLPRPTEAELAGDGDCVLCKRVMSVAQLHKGGVKKVPCGHCFHLECLGFWMGQKGNVIAHRCPRCRAPITGGSGSMVPNDE
jgi:hypothetical protein|eukprot:COSAG02_NODE_182_length_30594_cov_23.562912_5_plen_123_part_00